MSSFRKAIIFVAVPSSFLVIFWVILRLFGNPILVMEEVTIGDVCGTIGLGIAVIAILASIVFAIMRKREISKGTGFGGIIGLVVWWIAFGVMSWYLEGFA